MNYTKETAPRFHFYADENPDYPEQTASRYRIFYRDANKPEKTFSTDFHFVTLKAAERNAAVYQDIYNRYFLEEIQ